MENFTLLNINKDILKVLEEEDIKIPTEIQIQSIPVLLKHKGDFVGRAATGTGKTFAYGIPLISKIDINSGRTQAIVLVPTRELCEQVGNELSLLAKYSKGLKIKSIYGGVSLKSQIHDISNGIHIIVATPGRLMDLVERKVVHLEDLDTIVFDEADEMLLKGFQTDVDKILKSTNKSYSSWLFSATMPDEINGIIKKYLKNELVKVLVGESSRTNEGINHQVIEVIAEEKFSVLLHFLNKFEGQKGIIFCRTKSGASKLYKQLSANKFKCGAIHGDLPQGLRNKIMDQYKDGALPLLIATDVASRGVDVQNVAFVIQYHLPETTDAYTHRSGRTSRAGKTVISITFVFDEEKKKLKIIEDELNLDLKKLALPSEKNQLVNKAILWARKVARTKPLGIKLDEMSKQEFKDELIHLSNDELLEKLLSEYMG